MADIYTKKERSRLMSRIRSRGTGPELSMAAMLSRTRFKVCEHMASLPGRPDFVVKSRKVAVFVNGCFWHAHEACGAAEKCRNLASRSAFWAEKFRRNVARDRKAARRLRNQGWRVITIWECETKKMERLPARLEAALSRR